MTLYSSVLCSIINITIVCICTYTFIHLLNSADIRSSLSLSLSCLNPKCVFLEYLYWILLLFNRTVTNWLRYFKCRTIFWLLNFEHKQHCEEYFGKQSANCLPVGTCYFGFPWIPLSKYLGHFSHNWCILLWLDS